MRVRALFVALVLVSGCDEPLSSSDGGADASADAGGDRDAGTRDSGTPRDECAAGQQEAASTAGCNGAILGPDRADNAFGGRCTLVDGNDAGTCTGADAYCYAFVAGDRAGICLQTCTAGATYVSTGGCPSGSRCFNLNNVDLCFADCTEGADCSTHHCDGEASCVEPLCVTSADCTDDPTAPVCEADVCVGCTRTDQCSGGTVCNTGTGSCVSCTTMPSLCTGDTPVCATTGTAIGTCVQCVDWTDCFGATPICDANVCRACAGGADCMARDLSRPVCITDTADSRVGECVQCATSADCSGATPICDMGACRACADSTECEARGSAEPMCVTDTANILVGHCVPACLDVGATCDTLNDQCCAGLSCQSDGAAGFTCQLL
jgi:hypothetical protein